MLLEFLKDYLPIVIFIFIALFLSVGFVALNYLFSPKNRKYLYAKGNKSQVDFFRDDLLALPKLAETKYIEIVLYPGQMLYIPFNWWYNYEIIEDSFAVYQQSDTLFSKYLLKN